MKAADAIATLEELGADQWGLVTTGQAESYGVTRVALGRLHADEIIHRVRRGVYALPSAGHGPLQGVRAAWLATSPRVTAAARVQRGDDVVVSHVSAASVHGLGDLIPSVHEFSSSRRRQSTHPDVRFHRREVVDEDRAIVDGLPVTSVLRTVESLASAGTDLDHLADVVRDSLAKPEVRPGPLARRLDRVAHLYGHEGGDELVADCLNRAGLPPVAANLAAGSSSFKAVMDSVAPRLTLDAGYLDSLVRQSITPDLRAAIDRTLSTVFAEQMRGLVEHHGAAARAMQGQLGESMQRSFAPFWEAQTQAMRPALDALQASTARSLGRALEGSSQNAQDGRRKAADGVGRDDDRSEDEDEEI